MEVDGHRQVKAPGHLCYNLGHLLGEGAAVGVAQAEHVRPAPGGGLQGPQGEVPVVLPAVEEVLPVEDDLLAPLLQKAAALLDHPEVFLVGGLQHAVHVEFPALAEHGAAGGARRRQGLEIAVLLRPDAFAAGAAKGHQPGVGQGQLPGPGEKLSVLGVGARVPGLDIGHPQLV